MGVEPIEQIRVAIPQPKDYETDKAQHHPQGYAPNLHEVLIA
jgi:hypothetical protein